MGWRFGKISHFVRDDKMSGCHFEQKREIFLQFRDHGLKSEMLAAAQHDIVQDNIVSAQGE
jgi:hypothetical protein